MKYSFERQKKGINVKTEETIGLMHRIATIALQEFRDNAKKIGLRTSPDIFNEMETNKLEEEVIKDNILKFTSVFEFMRDSIDCYLILCRQKYRKPLSEETCTELFQYISRARFNVGELLEEMRILEKSVEAKAESYISLSMFFLTKTYN